MQNGLKFSLKGSTKGGIYFSIQKNVNWYWLLWNSWEFIFKTITKIAYEQRIKIRMHINCIKHSIDQSSA